MSMFNKLKSQINEIKNSPKKDKEEENGIDFNKLSKEELIKRIQNLEEEHKLVAEVKRSWQQNFTAQLESVEKERNAERQKVEELTAQISKVEKLEELVKFQEEHLKLEENKLKEFLIKGLTSDSPGDSSVDSPESMDDLKKRKELDDLKMRELERLLKDLQIQCSSLELKSQKESDELQKTKSLYEGEKTKTANLEENISTLLAQWEQTKQILEDKSAEASQKPELEETIRALTLQLDVVEKEKESEKTRLEGTIKMLQEMLKVEIENKATELKQKEVELKKQIESLQEKHKVEIENKATELKQKEDQLKKQIESLQEKHKVEVENSATEMKQKEDQLKKKIESLENELKSAKSETGETAEQLEKEKKAIEDQLTQAHQKLTDEIAVKEDVILQLKISKETLTQILEEKEKLEGDLRRTADDIEELKLQLLNARAEFEQYQMNNTNTEKQNQLDNLRRINRELEAEKRKVTSELNQLKESFKSSTRVTVGPAVDTSVNEPDGVTKVPSSNSLYPSRLSGTNGLPKDLGLAEAKAHIHHLEKLLAESEKTEKLHELQAETLRNEIREMERRTNRSDADTDYLKNAVVKYMESQDQHEKLFPVIASLLQFSPEEMKSIQDKTKRRAFGD